MFFFLSVTVLLTIVTIQIIKFQIMSQTFSLDVLYTRFLRTPQLSHGLFATHILTISTPGLETTSLEYKIDCTLLVGQ